MTTKDAGCDLLMDGSVTRPGGLPMAPPAYRRIADGLRSRILAGELPPGTRLPSIRQLARDHAVSDRTTRAVMAVLVADGLVEAPPSLHRSPPTSSPPAASPGGSTSPRGR
jgi:DNA-binding transcriptional MocR family regulator